MNKAVIFDLDGTLLDTLPDIAETVNIALKEFGYPERTVDEIRSFIGNGARQLLSDAMGNVGGDALSKCYEYFVKVYATHVNCKTKIFDGMDELLRGLKKKGYKLAILTNKPHEAATANYETFLKDYGFDLYLGSKEGVVSKPDPTATKYIMKELSVLPENTYFVGDGDADVKTAINAGVNGISVLWGYRNKKQLQEVGATTFAENPLQLLQLLDN